MQDRWKIELFYGYEDGESGIYHSFIAEDPSIQNCTAPEALAEMLGIDKDSQDFNWNSMCIELPSTVVDRIKADGVAEFLATRLGGIEDDLRSALDIIDYAAEQRGYEASYESDDESRRCMERNAKDWESLRKRLSALLDGE